MDTVKEVHIGKLIRAKMKEQGRTNVWLARQLPCSPNHIYKIYNSPTISTDQLVRISELLGYNFFKEFIQKG